jgi:hypothetical protein
MLIVQMTSEREEEVLEHLGGEGGVASPGCPLAPTASTGGRTRPRIPPPPRRTCDGVRRAARVLPIPLPHHLVPFLPLPAAVAAATLLDPPRKGSRGSLGWAG